MDKEIRLHNLMLELENKDKITDIQTREMFNLNNELWPDIAEWTVSCPACRSRVYNRMKNYWTTSGIKNKYSK